MREKKSFAIRTKVLASDEVRKKYFLVFEGENTEKIYFEALSSHRNEIGISPIIDIVHLVRSYSEQGWSNPQKILKRVLSNLDESATGVITYETLLNFIMEYFYDEEILTSSRKDAQNMWATLRLICQDKLKKDMSDKVDDLQVVCMKVAEYFAKATDIKNIVRDVPKIIKKRAITYDENLDKICFIIDRDGKSFVPLQYAYVLNSCRKNGFGFYLSNPSFEMWLLMHFDEVFKLDKDLLLENPKVTSERRYAEHELRKLLKGYDKSKYNTAALMELIDNAIENEKKFCEDEEMLEKNIGSRVGVLVSEMRGA